MSDIGFERVIYNIARSSLKNFLVEHGILRSPESIGRCPNCRLRAKLVWSTRQRNLTPATSHKKEEGECPARLLCIRCTTCKTRISPRSGTFFSYLDSNNRANSKVSLASIILIILKWSTKCPLTSTACALGISKSTAVDWFNFLREVCHEKFSRRDKMGGSGCLVEIDESPSRGRRKAQRGRMLLGDQVSESGYSSYPLSRRIKGPWVLGICLVSVDVQGKRHASEVRLFHVDKRDKETLNRVISAELNPGTSINTDEWGGYVDLNELGLDFDHKTVNHSENFVDPVTGAHTQTIEALSNPLKTKVLKNMQGTSSGLLLSHLSEYWAQSLAKDDKDFFYQTLRWINEQYSP